MRKETALQKAGNGAVQTQGPSGIIQAAMEAATRAVHIQTLATTALRLSKAFHWIDFNGKPYLEANGAEWISRVLGLDIHAHPERARRDDYEDEKGTYYVFSIPVTVSGYGEAVTMVGVCSSRDGLYGTYKDEDGDKHYRDESDVDPANVQRKAEANGVHRAFVAFLGIDGITWNVVNKALGCDARKKVDRKVDFEKGGKSKRSTARSDAKEAPPVSEQDMPFWAETEIAPSAPLPGGLEEAYQRKLGEREPGSDDDKE